MRRRQPIPQAMALFTALLVALAAWLAVAEAQEGARPVSPGQHILQFRRSEPHP